IFYLKLKRRDLLHAGIIAAITGMLFNALFTNSFHQTEVLVILTVLISILFMTDAKVITIKFFQNLRTDFKFVFAVFLFSFILMTCMMLILFSFEFNRHYKSQLKLKSGIYFYKAKMFSGAERELTESLIYNPGNAISHLYLATAFFNNEKHFLAIETALEGLKYLGHPQYEYILGISYLRTGEPLKALEHLERARVLFRNNRKIELDIAKAYCDLGRFEKAKEIVLKVYEEDPENVLCLMLYALILEQEGNYESMIKILQKILLLEPTNIYASKKLFDFRQNH
ncbi:MAG: tetratricopeptide repeat protein, partial [bacterium]|nr:tetratricopeptide repeat protein [bacterium]